MSAVKMGDTVRVVVVGEVTGLDGAAFTVSSGFAKNTFYHSAGTLVSVEVLKSPLKVGDIIKGEGAYQALPVGAVVKGEPWGESNLVRVKGGFIHVASPDELHESMGAFFDPRELVYLPEVAA